MIDGAPTNIADRSDKADEGIPITTKGTKQAKKDGWKAGMIDGAPAKIADRGGKAGEGKPISTHEKGRLDGRKEEWRGEYRIGYGWGTMQHALTATISLQVRHLDGDDGVVFGIRGDGQGAAKESRSLIHACKAQMA